MNSARLLDDFACCLTVTVKEAAAILGVGRNTAYEAIKRNEIPSVRIGRRLVVPRGALEQLLAARREPSGLSVEPKPVLGPQL